MEETMIIRNLPAVETRVEDGPIQFGDDWPGSFLRGDTCAFFAMNLEQYIKGDRNVFTIVAVEALLRQLKDTRV